MARSARTLPGRWNTPPIQYAKISPMLTRSHRCPAAVRAEPQWRRDERENQARDGHGELVVRSTSFPGLPPPVSRAGCGRSSANVVVLSRCSSANLLRVLLISTGCVDHSSNCLWRNVDSKSANAPLYRRQTDPPSQRLLRVEVHLWPHSENSVKMVTLRSSRVFALSAIYEDDRFERPSCRSEMMNARCSEPISPRPLRMSVDWRWARGAMPRSSVVATVTVLQEGDGRISRHRLTPRPQRYKLAVRRQP